MILRLALPLTVISFGTITQWWYALPFDAPETMLKGFPLAYTCSGWHTSLSIQLFLFEFVVDFSFYFLFWFLLLFSFDRFLLKIRTNKSIAVVLWTIASLFISLGAFIAVDKNNIFYLKRSFKMEVLATGIDFIWQTTVRP